MLKDTVNKLDPDFFLIQNSHTFNYYATVQIFLPEDFEKYSFILTPILTIFFIVCMYFELLMIFSKKIIDLHAEICSDIWKINNSLLY